MLMPLKVLFLHGLEGSPTSTKARLLAARGCDVVAPSLPAEDFGASVRIAQRAFDEARPDVVVGSSRGGAVALSIDPGEARVVLCCPAWRRFEVSAKAVPNTWILHAPADKEVAFADSVELLARSGLPSDRLVSVGHDHRLHGQPAFASLLRLVRGLRADVEPGVFTGERWVYAIESDRGGYYDATANDIVQDLTPKELDALETLIDADEVPFADAEVDLKVRMRVEAFFDPALERGAARFGEVDADDWYDLTGDVVVDHAPTWKDLFAAIDRAVAAAHGGAETAS